jgi:hypothetical protein
MQIDPAAKYFFKKLLRPLAGKIAEELALALSGYTTKATHFFWIISINIPSACGFQCTT